MPETADLQQVLSQSKTAAKLWARGGTVDIVRSHPHCFGLPPFVGNWLAIVRELNVELFVDQPVFLLLHEWSVFPEMEVPGLYERIRRSEGIGDSIMQAQVDVCYKGDEDYYTCLVCAALASDYKFLVVNSKDSCAAYFSNDEWFCPVVASQALVDQVHAIITSAGARRLNSHERRDLTAGFEMPD